jgi:hypothetical protein
VVHELLGLEPRARELHEEVDELALVEPAREEVLGLREQ